MAIDRSGGTLGNISSRNIHSCYLANKGRSVLSSRTSTTTPVYSHSESATGVAWTSTGFSVLNVKANIGIPVIGTTWSFSASSLTAGSNPPVIVPVK